VIATAPGTADGAIRECTELVIKRIWMHLYLGHKVMRVIYRRHVPKTV
jgi:hypothetical protein